VKIQLFVGIFLFSSTWIHAQQADSLLSKTDKIVSFPSRFFSHIQKKSAALNSSLDRQTERYLQRLQRKEEKFLSALSRKDSAAAARFVASSGKYNSLQKQMKKIDTSAKGSLSGEYMPYADSLKGSLAFLQQNQSDLILSAISRNRLTQSVGQFNELQGKLRVTDEAKTYIAERKEMMKQQLLRYANDAGMKKYLEDYSKAQFYFAEQLRQYRDLLNSPDRVLQKALVVLNKIPAFTSFMSRYGALAGLFGINPDYGTPAGLVGLQTRSQVQQLIQGQVGAGGSSGMAALQSNLEAAHQQLDQFKDKLSSLGSGSGDMDMPDFKPGHQKTRPFFKRLQLGTDLQTTRASYFWLTTTDIGLSVTYLASNKLDFGVGGSYKIGWEHNISHVRLSSQGASIRSFLDFQLKKTYYLSGGYELNYQQAFTSLSQISSVTDWTRSGLVGISKIVSLNSKFFKKTKVQMLWDFLSYSQFPRRTPIVFRVGYNF